MIPLTILFFFLLGLIIGSFLNVVIYRYNTEKSLGGRSACMVCQSKLRWYELIPLFSFITLRGRCRTCRTKISLQYPLVEVVTAAVFLALFFMIKDIFIGPLHIFIFTYLYYAALFSILIVIAVYDIRHKIIPDLLALIFGVLSFIGIFLFTDYGFYPHIPSIWELLAGPLVAAPFALLWLVSRGTWMGLGDAKLALGLGWLLGLSRAFSAVVISFWSGAIIGVLLIMFSKKYKMKSEIPFAPYLIGGALLVFLFKFHIFNLGF